MPTRNTILRRQVKKQNMIQVWASSESNLGKIRNIVEEQKGEALQTKNEVLIAELDVTSYIDFMDGYQHQVLIEYTQQEELSIKLLDLAPNPNQRNQVEPIAIIPLKLTDYISLDNGTAYLGFC